MAPERGSPRHTTPPERVSEHILTSSATMLGVCITVVSVVRLLEVNASIKTVIDNIIAVDSILFLLAAMLSYLSLRSARRWRLETYADTTFMLALIIMAAASVLLAWELG